MLKTYFNSWKKYFLVWHFIENQVFIISALFPCFSVFIQVYAISFSSDVVMQFKTQQIESLYMVFWFSFAFTRNDLEDVFKKVFRTSSGRRLGDVFKKGRRDFHFRPIYDVFETKIKTFLRRLCDVILSAGKGSQTVKFGLLIEHNMRNIFVEKSYTKCAGKSIPRP